MRKLLKTFFFGYASHKYRRLIRTPIILITVGVSVIAFYQFIIDQDVLFRDNDEIDSYYKFYRNKIAKINNDYIIVGDEDIKQFKTNSSIQFISSRREFVRLIKKDDSFNDFIANEKKNKWLEANPEKNEENYLVFYSIRRSLGLEPIKLDYLGLLLLFICSEFFLIGVISFLIEPFIIKKEIIIRESLIPKDETK